MGWIEDGVTVSDKASAEGYTVERHGVRPCPKCGAHRRGSKDKRPPVSLRRNDSAWWCHACKTGGGPSAFGDFDPADIKPYVDRRPLPLSESDVIPVWRSCGPIDEETRGDLYGRGIDADGVWMTDGARGKSRVGRPWWPFGLPLTLPMYDHRGRLRALHARKLHGKGQKGLSVKGRPVSGLLFADQGALGAMDGHQAILGVVCEGATDHLAMSTHVAKHHTEEAAVWGGVSGSWSGLRHGNAMEWLILTDPDPAGDKYAIECHRALAGGAVRRFRGDTDVCDLLTRGVTLLDMLKGSQRLR